MFRSILACLCIATAIAASPASKQLSQLSGDVLIVKDFAEFRAQHPELVFTPMEKKETKNLIIYTLGRRVNGDRLAAQKSDGAQWSSPQNVQLVLEYPATGIGSIVSYVVIQVDQSSNLGNAYTTAGGIGQRFVKIVIEAASTNFLYYTASVFGY